MSLSLTVMLALLMQSRRPPIVLTMPPICKDVAVTVKSIEPKHYRFQLDILNDSSGPIVLLGRLDWNLAVKNASRMEDDDTRGEHRKSTNQLRPRRESFTREIFEQLDQGAMNPLIIRAEVIGLLSPILFSQCLQSGAPLGEVLCPATPVVFTEQETARRR